MYGSCRAPAIAALLVGLISLLPAPASAMDLTGVWASQGDLCKMAFTKKGNEVVFAELSDLYGSGFIIDGNRIKAKAVECTINSKKQSGDMIELNASCASTITTQNASFLLKVIDDNNFARVIPEIENMEIRYTRCRI
jgi:hypothetical protein